MLAISGFQFESFGFAGSRWGSGISAARLSGYVSRFGPVSTTCASGICAAVRLAVPSAAVFSVTAVPVSVPYRARFAVRASSFVSALAASPSPVLLCWPGRAAPAAVRPSRSWVSCGSGSWSELALAVGLGVSVVVFLPSGVSPPSWGPWVALSLGSFSGGWLLQPLAVQAGFF